MIIDRVHLKKYFEPGDKPTQSDYANLIDSLLHRTEDKAPASSALDTSNDEQFVTPKVAKMIADKATVKTVNSIAPDNNGNVQVINISGSADTITGNIKLEQVIGLLGLLAGKISSGDLKTINEQTLVGQGNINIGGGGQKKIYAVPANPHTILGTSPANAFPPVCEMVTLDANKTYLFKGKYYITNGTSHTISIGWAVNRLNVVSMEYYVKMFSSQLNAYATALTQTQVSGIGIKVLNSSTAQPTSSIEFEGILRCTTGGTITPQIAFSTPSSTPLSVMKVGSFIEFTEIGPDTMNYLE